mgnify:CR=1 FL=1
MYDVDQDLDYFTKKEFACQHTGDNEIKDTFLLKLDLLRARCGFPFIITSGYRSPEHPIESRKEKAGTHAQGIAADIKVEEAIKMGFGGIGIHSVFIHVDMRNVADSDAPVMWLY